MHFGETSDAVHVRVREGELDRGLWEMVAAVPTGHRLDAVAGSANAAQCARMEEHCPDQGREGCTVLRAGGTTPAGLCLGQGATFAEGH